MEAFERVARAAVDEASAMLQATWRDAKTVEHKGAVDIVTDTDRAIEAAIIARLHHAFPDHVVIAEESSELSTLTAPPSDRHVWYLDPLDGTTNFAHAYPQFAVSLALGIGDQLLFGIVHDPVRDRVVGAAQRLLRAVGRHHHHDSFAVEHAGFYIGA